MNTVRYYRYAYNSNSAFVRDDTPRLREVRTRLRIITITSPAESLIAAVQPMTTYCVNYHRYRQ